MLIFMLGEPARPGHSTGRSLENRRVSESLRRAWILRYWLLRATRPLLRFVRPVTHSSEEISLVRGGHFSAPATPRPKSLAICR